MTLELRTARTNLRPVGPDDAEELLAVFRDPAIRRYLLDDELVAPEWVAAEIESSRRSFGDSGWGIWGIRTAGSRIVGFVGFRHFFEPPQLQLLYGLLPEYWGRGLATEAAGAVCDYAFNELGFATIVAATDEPNSASIGVMERLGMNLDRRTDDGTDGTVYYSLRRTDE